MELPMQIKERVSNLQDIDHDLFLRWLPKVERAFQANLGGNFAEFADCLDDATLLGVEHCASQLAREDPDPEIKPADLADISKSVEELLTGVRDSETDPAVRLFILKHLYMIRRAIDEYQLFGAKPLATALGEAIAATITEPVKSLQTKSSPQGVKFWDFIKRISAVLTVTEGTAKLAERLSKLLDFDAS